jgi:hypothetical protein
MSRDRGVPSLEMHLEPRWRWRKRLGQSAVTRAIQEIPANPKILEIKLS